MQKMVDARAKTSTTNLLLSKGRVSVSDLSEKYSVGVGDDDVVYLSNDAGDEQTFVVHGVIGHALLPGVGVLRKYVRRLHG